MRVFKRFWTSAIVVMGSFACVLVEGASLRFYHRSIHNYTEIPLEEPLRILPYLNRSLASTFFVFGFNETAISTDSIIMISAYLTTTYTNVILLDWSEESRVGLLGVILSYIFKAVPNTRRVGRQLGQSLVILIENGISEDRIHLVGHSLGAHLAGYAGEMVKSYGYQLARITGLDPAGPLFEGLINMNGLNPSRAKFVDVIHTDPNLYGVKNSIGSIDIWANCGLNAQPGCPDEKSISNLESFCSHWRSYEYFAEAVLFPNTFTAVKADNCTAWRNLNQSQQIIYIGDVVNTSVRGNFYFSTNGYPFLVKKNRV